MKGNRAAGGCLILVLLFLLLFLIFSGLTIVLEAPWFVVTGWLYFLVRVLPQVRVNVEAVVAALLVAGALFAGLHAVLSRIDRHVRSDEPSARPWRLRSTASFFGLFVAMLLCSMASIGAVHHIGWLFSGGKLTYSNHDIEPFPALRSIRPLCESFARSSGDVYERARVFGPIRETHHVLVQEGSNDVLMFERNPQNPEVSYTMYCASDGDVHLGGFDRDKALEMFRSLGRSPKDGGVPDALEGGAAP
ncbi:hypothetical protein [Polyangium jinanense]|uniref:Uncharacterized protein n=1 Tax=Polyangium jinanense TaxID=2829994 RepID=A0A9X4AVX2_9BACT|nr:hypothetical protein [Polyangium jinanense]MDC3960463.1 hypothetical protein [Polyangium jinanense]MDC3986764.1 hypothetical protein [Polyangium jinanense]